MSLNVDIAASGNILSNCKIFLSCISNWRLLREITSYYEGSSYIKTLFASRGNQSFLLDAMDIVQKVDGKLFRQVYKDHYCESPYPGHSKYLDISSHTVRAVKQAYRLDLNNAQKKYILDIGSGAGYFPFTCKHYGHQAFALDVDDNIMYNKLKKLLNIDCYVHRIKPFEPLPKMSNNFDLITAFQTLFDQPEGDRCWEPEQWSYFIKDLNNWLNKEGEIFISLNTFPKNKKKYLKRNLAYFKKIGAKINQECVLIPAGSF